MNIDSSNLIWYILFGQFSVNLLIFIVFISGQRAKKTSSAETQVLRNEIERLNSRLSVKEEEFSEVLTQKSAREEELLAVREDTSNLKQEYEKKLHDPLRQKEIEIIREENQKLNVRLSAKEQELAKALSSKSAAEEAFKKVSEDKGVLKQEYEKELQGLVDRKEFERLKEENQKLNSELLVKEAELFKISAQKSAAEEVIKQSAAEEANLKQEYEKKLHGLADRKDLELLKEENQRLKVLVSTKEQELLKTLALKSAIEGAFREISSNRPVLGKEQEEKAKELLGPELLQRFEEEKKKLNSQILIKDKELVEAKAQNSAAQEELEKSKSDLLSQGQKSEKLIADEREKLSIQLQQKEKEFTQALEQKEKSAEELRKNMEAMVDKAQLAALQEKFDQSTKELSEALAQKSKTEEAVKQAIEEQAKLKQDYEQKLQNMIERKEFERLREENQKLNAEIIAKEEQYSRAAEEKKAAGKKSGRAGKDAQALDSASVKDKSKEGSEEEGIPTSKGAAFPKAGELEPSALFVGELPEDLISYVQEQEQKIGSLLKSNGLVEESLWQKALNYQKQHRGSSLMHYLLAYDYLKEDQLAECLCDYFKIPYLPLSKYEIPEEVVKQIPQDILEKYLVVPVFKSGNIINVVMGNPFDAKAIRAIEETTGCKVRPFVGLFSEIIATLKIFVHMRSGGSVKYPFFVETKSYTGLERRESVRIDAALDIEFLAEGGYKRSVTKNVSRDGFCFEAEISIPVGSIFPIMVYLPVHISPLPIKVITKVVKVIPLADNKFELRLNTIKIAKEELNKIIEFATSSKEKQSGNK